MIPGTPGTAGLGDADGAREVEEELVGGPQQFAPLLQVVGEDQIRQEHLGAVRQMGRWGI